MHFSSLVPLALLSGLSLTSAQYTEVLTSAIAQLSQATASITVHSGAVYSSALAEAESGYNEITGILYANPSLSSQYGSLVSVFASELSGFTKPAAAAATVSSSAAGSASSVASSAAGSLSSAISSATSAASSISSSAASAAASSAASSSAVSAAGSSPSASPSSSSSSNGAGVISVSVMGVMGAGLLGLASWL